MINFMILVLSFFGFFLFMSKAIDFLFYIKNKIRPSPLYFRISDSFVLYSLNSCPEEKVLPLANKIVRIRNIFMKYQDLKEKKGRVIEKILYPSWLQIYLYYVTKPITMKDGIKFESYDGNFLRVVYCD